MDKIISKITARLSAFGPTDALDIIVLGIVVFLLYKFMRHRRVFSIFIGAFVFVVFKWACGVAGLTAAYKLAQAFTLPGMIMIAVIFQADLRSVLESTGAKVLGTFRALRGEFRSVYGSPETDEIVSSVVNMSSLKTGAMLIFEGSTGIDDVCERGVVIDARISAELFKNLFAPPAPLHDGAVVIRGGRVYAAGCFVPSTDVPDLNPSFGSRHRAAIAMSRICDADVIVISEEDGKISHARKGELTVGLDEEKLRAVLARHFGKIKKPKRRKKNSGKASEVTSGKDSGASGCSGSVNGYGAGTGSGAGNGDGTGFGIVNGNVNFASGVSGGADIYGAEEIGTGEVTNVDTIVAANGDAVICVGVGVGVDGVGVDGVGVDGVEEEEEATLRSIMRKDYKVKRSIPLDILAALFSLAIAAVLWAILGS